MLEIGIPVYKSRETLPQALNSLLCQTRQMFITCLSIDADGEDYSDIINDYTARGLKIRVINATENGGPGGARRRIVETTQADYLMFMDADDMLFPTAAETLYTNAKANNFDIVRSNYLQEHEHQTNILLTSNNSSITHLHGKIYKVSFLKEKGINFLPELKTEEDAYFNVVAWNCNCKKGEINETTYLWRDNKNSITRKDSKIDYFKQHYYLYIYSQVKGMKKLFEIDNSISIELFALTLINLYYYYMQARFYNLDEKCMDNILSEFNNTDWFNCLYSSEEFWIEIMNSIKAGCIIDGTIIFFKEPFNEWLGRIIKNENYNR